MSGSNIKSSMERTKISLSSEPKGSGAKPNIKNQLPRTSISTTGDLNAKNGSRVPSKKNTSGRDTKNITKSTTRTGTGPKQSGL